MRRSALSAMRPPSHRAVRAGAAALCLALAGCAAAQRDAALPDRWVGTDDPADFCPPEARFFIRLDGLSRWLATEDPLVQRLWSAIEPETRPALWDRAAANLEIPADVLFDACFGQRLTMVDLAVENKHRAVVIARAQPGWAQRLPRALELRAAGRLGPFALFAGQGDDPLLLAVDRDWMLITDLECRAHLRRAVASATLARNIVRDPAYRRLRDRLPVQARIVLRNWNAADRQQHVLAVVPRNGRTVAHYAADIPRVAALPPAEPSDATEPDFGPLPADLVMAASIQDLSMAPGELPMLDALLFPSNVRDAILPRLQSPAVGFIGQLPAEAVWPRAADRPAGIDRVPVVGLALHLRDPSVAHDLEGMLRRMHVFANLSELDLGRVFFGVQGAREGRFTFQTADFGLALQRRVTDPDFAPLMRLPSSAGLSRLTYGRIGSWYVICSQEAFFRRCVEIHRNPGQGVNRSASVRAFPYEPKPRPLLCAVTQAPELARLIQSVETYWRQAHEKPDEPASDGTSDQLRHRPLQWMAQTLRHRRSIHLQLWREADRTVGGRLNVMAPESP